MTIPLSEMKLSDAALDRAAEPVRHKVLICAMPRTGSFMLCRAMIHHGIGVPHEYFHHLHAHTIGMRCGIAELQDGEALATDAAARRAYIAALLARRTANGIFAAKIQWWEFERYLNNPEGFALLQGAHFIHLCREDLLDQAVSYQVAMLTGEWGRPGDPTTPPEPNPQFFDPAQIDSRLKALVLGDMNWRLLFARNAITPLSIAYEAMRQDLPGTLRRITESFGLAVPAPATPYREGAPYESRPGVPSKAEIRARFTQASRRIVPAPRPKPAR